MELLKTVNRAETIINCYKKHIIVTSININIRLDNETYKISRIFRKVLRA